MAKSNISSSISNCAASVCIFREGFVKGYIRLSLIAIWMVLFIAYIGVFAKRLQKWDNDIPSYCYKTDATARRQDSHPYVDNVYIGITVLFICLSFFYALSLSLGSELRRLQNNLEATASTMGSGATDLRIFGRYAVSPESLQFMVQLYPDLLAATSLTIPATDLQYSILGIAMLQCPLHIYSIFALRASNEHYLEGDSERNWGFGQIVAVVLLGGNILQFIDGLIGMCLPQSRSKYGLMLLP